jgi:hypothetical protein
MENSWPVEGGNSALTVQNSQKDQLRTSYGRPRTPTYMGYRVKPYLIELYISASVDVLRTPEE